ncbi:MAG: helix-turn-helix transcriptional regulator, partial [Lachnospiraceae bacterium]|nr:helix-turn-helix transcriptional regulator [Lachnospiraceae bacterium]
MSIGTTIAKKRKALGFTQKELADRLKVSFQAISKWEKGISNPDVELLPALAEILGTTVDALVGYRSPILAD